LENDEETDKTHTHTHTHVGKGVSFAVLYKSEEAQEFVDVMVGKKILLGCDAVSLARTNASIIRVERISELRTTLSVTSNLMMEAISSSETSVLTTAT
jgi:hypothetical protein